MKIYIIRHGETSGNEEGRFQGRYDSVLNASGIRLAEETGIALKGTHFDIAFSSPLSRAKQTAELILKNSENTCEIKFDDRLLEMAAGDYENKHFKPEAHEIDPEAVKSFFLDPLHTARFPNGENVKDAMKRTQEFIRELAGKEYQSVLVSTHGVALRAMLNFIYKDPSDFWHGHVPYNCALSIVEASDGNFCLEADDLILYDKTQCIDRYADF